jgi:AGCS family alanine or glycine:cation symporter
LLELIDRIIRDSATTLWSYPMLVFLTVAGLFFTIRLKGIQFTRFFSAGKLTIRYRRGSGQGNMTPIQSLFSALGGMIGNGNIAGVATAIAIGGPGAVFWLWISSLIAMVIVYAETLLAISHRIRTGDGTFSGGPMFYIEKLLKIRWLAVLFALAMGLKTLLATSTIQSNSIALAATRVFNLSGLPDWVPPLLPFSFCLAVLTWLVVIGGLKSIARTLEKITPLMVVLYFILSVVVIVHFRQEFGDMLRLIVSRAFTPAGAVGGFSGSTVLLSMRYGVARGFYSNEAGTGSSAIMFSTARTDQPVKQSLIGMFGVVIDTMVGTLTAFIILITGVWSTGETSTALTTAAFAQTFGRNGVYFVFAASFLFGYSTLIAWCFYGEQCFVYIWGTSMRTIFRWAFCTVIIFGFFRPELVWSSADILNGSIVIINVIALIFLIRHVVRITRSAKLN